MSELTDATIFSKLYPIVLKRTVSKKELEEMLKSLIQSIGKPLAHNGVIIGHIKLIAELSDKEFLFLSLTRMDRVDMIPSTDLNCESDEIIGFDLKINVLIFGQSKSVITDVVSASIAALI